MRRKRFWGAHGFLGPGYARPGQTGAKVHIVPIPCETTVTYGGGTAEGPQGIIEASWNLEVYDMARDRELHAVGIHTCPPVDCTGPIAEIHDRIERKAKAVVRRSVFPVFLGGEHSITYPILRAFRSMGPPFTVLCLDAHADMRDQYEGEPLSHACVMRRISELGVPVVHVGMRSMGPEERDAVREGPVRFFPMHEMRGDSSWMEAAAEACLRRVYLSIDVDAFDPSLVPSTGTPEPGGLSWDEVITFLAVLEKRGHVPVGADIVELAPIQGLLHPDFLCAKLLYALVGWRFFPIK
jgi:agmatinase